MIKINNAMMNVFPQLLRVPGCES